MTDRILGIDFLWANRKIIREHSALETTRKRFIELGTNTVQLAVLGQRVIVTSEPDILKTVLALEFKSFCLPDGRKKIMVPFLGEGIFTTDGIAWQHSRDMLRPIFVRSQLVEDLEMFERRVNHLIEAIPKDHSTVDLQTLFFRFTLDLATEFLFGESTNCLLPGRESESSAKFVEAFNYCQSFGDGDGMNPLSILLRFRAFKKDFVDELIKKALSNRQMAAEKSTTEPGRVTFLSQLAAETTDRVKIRSELLNLLLAGRDTTAALMANVFFELSRRPEMQSRVRREIDTCIGAGLPTFEGIKSMKYLRAVFNESLRTHPIVPENSRQAVQDTVLPLGGGEDGKSPALIKKGQLLAWSSYSMHRRGDLYGEDAAEFRPERWLDDANEKGLRVGWEYLPFNGGPRICIGQQFALLESSYVVIRILQSFSHIESRDAEPWREKLMLTCISLGGCKVALTPNA
ncbi:MAG: hypothetical protein HETSPECPRED_008940 [Heterodermia speciosa]|uniref:Cytochrome P450 n=1 Tax=Heterodermia speciosa TaxID=116794 RepID=A0A8H3ELD1_9LECA|nr:MAG: hypothetical protein HETSPECPRED_008940 [Heterodermia speciosa]